MCPFAYATSVWLRDVLPDPGTHDDVRADHERVLAAGGYGVPTLFFPDGQCLFGPVLIDPPADERAIVHALGPYLSGRDWISVDRGEVIDLPAGRATKGGRP